MSSASLLLQRLCWFSLETSHDWYLTTLSGCDVATLVLSTTNAETCSDESCLSLDENLHFSSVCPRTEYVLLVLYGLSHVLSFL